jgi:hypothetical protein
MEENKSQKIAKKYNCVSCNYNTSNIFDYNKHKLTSKHIKTYNGSIQEEKKVFLSQNVANKFICDCGKSFKTHGGIWKHKKKCNNAHIHDDPDNTIMTLVMEVVKNNTELQKQNDEFKTMLLEQNNKMIETVQEVCKSNNSNIINSNINSNNKAFNLNVFLNETCKDAMDINDFIDSVKLQLSDLELVGKLGFVDGISSIIIKNLKALKENERPVHCTDLKRETMYVKEQGIWEKQEGDYKNLRKVIKRIAFKNSKNLSLYKELHPDYNDYYSKHSDHYLKLQIEAFGGSGNETIDNENKIIKKIAKEMAIDKSL